MLRLFLFLFLMVIQRLPLFLSRSHDQTIINLIININIINTSSILRTNHAQLRLVVVLRRETKGAVDFVGVEKRAVLRLRLPQHGRPRERELKRVAAGCDEG